MRVSYRAATSRRCPLRVCGLSNQIREGKLRRPLPVLDGDGLPHFQGRLQRLDPVTVVVCWKRLDQFGATHHVEIRLDTSGFDDLDGSLGVGLYSGVDLLCFNLGEERLKVVSGMDIRIPPGRCKSPRG